MWSDPTDHRWLSLLGDHTWLPRKPGRKQCRRAVSHSSTRPSGIAKLLTRCPLSVMTRLPGSEVRPAWLLTFYRPTRRQRNGSPRPLPEMASLLKSCSPHLSPPSSRHSIFFSFLSFFTLKNNPHQQCDLFLPELHNFIWAKWL